VICSPDRLHFAHARACLINGKHVLLEKPMSISADEASSLVDLADSMGLILATGYHLRSHAGHLEVQARIERGDIGPLRHVRAIWAFQQKDDSNWRAAGDLGKMVSRRCGRTHCLDLARWFANDMDEWRQFSSVISNSIWQGPHDESGSHRRSARIGRPSRSRVPFNLVRTPSC